MLLESRRDREDIELLIQGQKLAPLLAATLMNDCQTVRRIQRQLLKASNLLFVTFELRSVMPEQLLATFFCELPPPVVSSSVEPQSPADGLSAGEEGDSMTGSLV